MKKAFTLAEVLITLGIIGVVAALVMPGVIANHKKQKTISGLREIYSILSQAARRAEYDNGSEIENWDMNLPPQQFAQKYFVPYLKVAKTCTTMAQGCWKVDGFNGYYDLAKTKILNMTPYSIVLANGMTLGFAAPISMGGNYAHIIVADINGGANKPNMLGYDVFPFYVFSSTLSYGGNASWAKMQGLLMGSYTNGGGPQAYYMMLPIYGRDCLLWKSSCAAGTRDGMCSKTSVGTAEIGRGGACGLVIMEDGWQIKDDYPVKF